MTSYCSFLAYQKCVNKTAAVSEFREGQEKLKAGPFLQNYLSTKEQPFVSRLILHKKMSEICKETHL